MKQLACLGLMLIVHLSSAQSLPVITASPTNTTVYPGATATFWVAASGATAWQWSFNGTNISGATNATFQVLNAQSTNCGYYMVTAKNETGLVPSQMAYLFLDYTFGGGNPTLAGTLPFSNKKNTGYNGAVGSAVLEGPPVNGYVQIVAGPQLDEMLPVGKKLYCGSGLISNQYTNGYYNATNQAVPTIQPGQIVYYSVSAFFTNNGTAYTEPSTIMNLAAGTNGYPSTPPSGLLYPTYDEWPNPFINFNYVYTLNTNQLRVPGETVSFTNTYFAVYTTTSVQWRKNGINIPNATNFSWNFMYESAQSVLTMTNVQPSDAGVYDAVIYGDEWQIGPKIYLSVQTTNGQGVLENPSFSGTNMMCDLVGAAGRNYMVQVSTNLIGWSNFMTLSNLTGIITFTNAPSAAGSQFYRTVLMP